MYTCLILQEFQTFILIFFYGTEKIKVSRLSTYSPYEFGGFAMIDYESMIKALRLSWLKKSLIRIAIMAFKSLTSISTF